MKRIFSVLLVALLLWCTFTAYAGACQYFEDFVWTYPIHYSINSVDARGFAFEVRLISHLNDEYYENNDISLAEQILKDDTDGDLRTMDVASIWIGDMSLDSYGTGKFESWVVYDNILVELVTAIDNFLIAWIGNLNRFPLL